MIPLAIAALDSLSERLNAYLALLGTEVLRDTIQKAVIVGFQPTSIAMCLDRKGNKEDKALAFFGLWLVAPTLAKFPHYCGVEKDSIQIIIILT